MEELKAHKQASIRFGPSVSKACRSCSASSSAVVALADRTPKPSPTDTQSISGLPISVSDRAQGPLLGMICCLANSTLRIWYALFAHTIVVTFRFSLACVQRACKLYIQDPSACKFITHRLGQARAAPTASGGPQPMAPPVNARCENCGQPCDRSQYEFPLVRDSSTSIVPSGCRAATT